MMKRITLSNMVAIFLLLLSSAGVFAHDQSMHKGKATEGEIVSVSSSAFTMEASGSLIVVTLDKNTKYEIGEKAANKTDLMKGMKVKVYGVKLPGGKIAAKEVLLEEHGEHDGHGKAEMGSEDEMAVVLSSYLTLSAALAGDDAGKAAEVFSSLKTQLDNAKAPELKGVAPLIKSTSGKAELAELRNQFGELSGRLIPIVEASNHHGALKYQKVFCPMGMDNKGAHWLQVGNEVRNPYFGGEMLACGELVQAKKEEDHMDHGHSQGDHY